MAEKKRQPSEGEKHRLAPEVQDALARLAQAQDHAHRVLESVGLVSARTRNGSSVEFRLTDGDAATRSASLIPHWDAATRVLRVGQRVVKQYRVPAAAQEAILAAFQEEGWPPHLDDPLPPVRDGYPKDRLRDAIRHLNANQKNRRLRFRGDGTGQGVLWELIDERPSRVQSPGP